jgi:hypothetical protein
MATDSASAIFSNVTKNIGKIAKEVKDLAEKGKYLQASMKSAGEAGKYAGFVSGGLGALVGVHQKVMNVAAMQDSLNQIKVLTGKSGGKIYDRHVFREHGIHIGRYLANDEANGHERQGCQQFV